MLKIKNFIVFVVLAFSFMYFVSCKANSKQECDLCLKNSYDFYKINFMTKDGRIMDPEKNNITTSEGQSYIMLRSVTMGDKATFNKAYTWAKNNLQRKDKLFAWLWGEDKDGKYRILDNNSASDADVDIAFALILASRKWNMPEYLNEAIPIINSIWDNETKRVGNYLILMPGVEQTNSKKIEVNPSYFAPYSFRFFQKYDQKHNWNCLVDSSYYYIMASSAMTKTGLPPNWFLIEDDGNGGTKIVLEDSPRSDFSYDAIRVFFRTYLDYARTGETRALPVLEKSKFFISKWKDDNSYYTNYKSNGELADKNEFIGSIAILLPPIKLYDSMFAFNVYKSQLEPYFKNQKYWEIKHDYYAKNLMWFGCYMFNSDSNEYKEMHKSRIIGY